MFWFPPWRTCRVSGSNRGPELVVDLKEESHSKDTRRSSGSAIVLAIVEGELLIGEDLMPPLREKSVERISSHNIEKLVVTIEKRLLCVTFLDHVQASFDWTSCVFNS